jgi:hypothetical protein
MKAQLNKLHLAMLYSPPWSLGENMASYLEMETVQDKAMCVLQFFETKSVANMHLRYRTQYGIGPRSDNVIQRWLKQFQEIDNVLYPEGEER